MNFDFTDDQKFLKAEARRFLEARCPPAVTRKVLDNPETEPRSRVVEGRCRNGLDSGHDHSRRRSAVLGMSQVDLCAIAQELGRVIAPIPFASAVYVFAEAVMKARRRRLRRRSLLPGVASGEVIGCLATAEGPGAIAADAVKTGVARRARSRA